MEVEMANANKPLGDSKVDSAKTQSVYMMMKKMRSLVHGYGYTKVQQE